MTQTLVPDRPEFEYLDLSMDPSEWPKVKVIAPSGQVSWKFIPEVQDEDIVVLKKNGVPEMMYNQPGRPKKSDKTEEAVDRSDANQVSRAKNMERLRQKEAMTSVDPLVQAVRTDIDSSSILQISILSLAEELAGLKFDRLMAEQDGEPAAAYSMRRINALEKLINNWMKRKSMLDATSVDLDSKAFGVVFQLILETFIQALNDAGVEPETLQTIISNFANMVKKDEWKAQARSNLSNLSK
jgi:hypothetical protein